MSMLGQLRSLRPVLSSLPCTPSFLRLHALTAAYDSEYPTHPLLLRDLPI